MLDHVGFAVADYDRSKAFYEKALQPLGLRLLLEPAGQAAGFGAGDKATFGWRRRANRSADASTSLSGSSGASRLTSSTRSRSSGRKGQRATRGARHLSPRLLRRLRARSGWQQHRGRLPRPGVGRNYRGANHSRFAAARGAVARLLLRELNVPKQNSRFADRTRRHSSGCVKGEASRRCVRAAQWAVKSRLGLLRRRAARLHRLSLVPRAPCAPQAQAQFGWRARGRTQRGGRTCPRAGWL